MRSWLAALAAFWGCEGDQGPEGAIGPPRPIPLPGEFQKHSRVEHAASWYRLMIRTRSLKR